MNSVLREQILSFNADLPLEKAAIHEHLNAHCAAFITTVDEMFGAGNDAGSSEELNVRHGRSVYMAGRTRGLSSWGIE